MEWILRQEKVRMEVSGSLALVCTNVLLPPSLTRTIFADK